MESTPKYLRKPQWLRLELQVTPEYKEVEETLQRQGLNTVCREARCPNLHECWSRHKTATFMILGDTCTRRCRFCNVKTGLPQAPDLDEPVRVAQAAARMGLAHVVVTMVNRDDLPDGGADILARTVEELRKALPDSSVEVLAGDFMGKRDALERLLASGPDILGHNLETVRRLSPLIRSRSDYDRSLAWLAHGADHAKTHPESAMAVKSSLMLGLGESREEVLETLGDLKKAGVDMVNLGQYLQPTVQHAPVLKYWTPEEFARLKVDALAMGFSQVESGPLVRSSYHAGQQYEERRRKIHPLNKGD